MGDDGEDLASVVVPLFGVIKFAWNKQTMVTGERLLRIFPFKRNLISPNSTKSLETSPLTFTTWYFCVEFDIGYLQ